MRTRFVEATQAVEGGFNHGKFMVALFTSEEWQMISTVDEWYLTGIREAVTARSLLRRCGWTPRHALVLDLATGEGALFLPGGIPKADLEKHRVWVCPMFEPFLGWLYEHVAKVGEERPPSPSIGFVGTLPEWPDTGSRGWFAALPPLVELPHAPQSQYGYRRSGQVVETEGG